MSNTSAYFIILTLFALAFGGGCEDEPDPCDEENFDGLSCFFSGLEPEKELPPCGDETIWPWEECEPRVYSIRDLGDTLGLGEQATRELLKSGGYLPLDAQGPSLYSIDRAGLKALATASAEACLSFVAQ